ncbi:MAG TPA: 2-oxo acid dehydrogenase subunit E2, partial [Flavobacterium sp.]
MIEFLMPSLGAAMEDGILLEWKKKPGEAVKPGDIIAEVETQKGLVEIEVFEEGIIGELLIQEGTKVPVGTAMATINPSGVALETKEEKTTEPIPVEKASIIPSKVAPLARIFAENNHIDLSQITGTGPEGVITKEDVDNAMAERDKIEIKKNEKIPAETEKRETPAEAIRSAVAAAMSKSNSEIPHYYLEKRIDMTHALAWLHVVNSKRSIKQRLLPVALLIKATAKSLLEFPDLNAIWDNGLQLKKDINIGIVVSLRTG